MVDRACDRTAWSKPRVPIDIQHRWWLKVVDKRIAWCCMRTPTTTTVALLRDVAFLSDVALLCDVAFLGDIPLLRCTTATFQRTTTVAAEDFVQHGIDPMHNCWKYVWEADRATSATTAFTVTATLLCDATFLKDFALLMDGSVLDDGTFLMDVPFLHDVAALLRHAATTRLLGGTPAAAI